MRLIYGITAAQAFHKDFGLRDQIRRASVSVMANIAEGFGASSDLDFSRYLSMSIRSALEVQSHLYVALDLGYVGEGDFKKVYNLTEDCMNLSKALIRYLKKSKN